MVHDQSYSVQGPWSINVIEIDLPAAWRAEVRLAVRRSSPDREGEKTSSLAKNAVAAVNGDFFYASGRPLGMLIENGSLRQEPNSRSAFAITADGRPSIGVFRLAGGLITDSGQTVEVNRLNRKSVRSPTFFNYIAQESMDSVKAEVGFKLQGVNGPIAINDTTDGRVLQIRRRNWPLRLDKDQWLLAVDAGSIPESVAAGDTVSVFLSLPPAQGQLLHGIGGGPRIVRDGAVSVEYEAEYLDYGFAADRNSRTAIGYTEDRKTLFLVTVDGGQPGYSVGMRLEELGEFMATRLAEFSVSGVNAHQALNMDGGGSTTMVIGGEVVNRPSDPIGERPVGNALLIVDGQQSSGRPELGENR